MARARGRTSGLHARRGGRIPVCLRAQPHPRRVRTEQRASGSGGDNYAAGGSRGWDRGRGADGSSGPHPNAGVHDCALQRGLGRDGAQFGLPVTGVLEGDCRTGIGRKWAAGAVLVSETWPARHRAKAIGWMQSGWAIGYLLAAAASALILPRFGWRWLFAVGFLPALVAVLIRRGVKEPEVWSGERPRPFARSGGFFARRWQAPPARHRVDDVRAFRLLGSFHLVAGILSAPVSAGGAGLTVLQGSTWMIPTQIGAFFGYVSFGWLADRIGRRPAFALYVVVAAMLTPLYGMTRSENLIFAFGPVHGLFRLGILQLVRRDVGRVVPNRRASVRAGVYV